MNQGKNLFQSAQAFKTQVAIQDQTQPYTYQDLLGQSASLAKYIQESLGNIEGERVLFPAQQDGSYVIMLWAIWRLGAIAVPLSLHHPEAELEYIREDTQARVLLVEASFAEKLKAWEKVPRLNIIHLEQLDWSAQKESDSLQGLCPDDAPALMIYTSGTTSRPKGVLTNHGNIKAQVACLVKAWEWSSADAILHVLPLHHVHGLINALLCALSVGAKVKMLPKFEASSVWESFGKGDLSLFMAVPSIYHRLIQHWEQASDPKREEWKVGLAKFRLMVSGSAALPISVLEKWENISGLRLLERYGMTEIGMAVSNPLHGKRKAGSIGQPLPGVELILKDEDKNEIKAEEEAGEIWIKSPSVFQEYWGKTKATEEAFHEGWFRTGDIAQRDAEGYYKILGRNSVDILKSGGYKISALEIEEVLRKHPDIQECAVIGLEDENWGEAVAAVLVLKPEMSLGLEGLRIWGKNYLAPYKLPTRLKVVAELPRNAMSKVVKPQLKTLFE